MEEIFSAISPAVLLVLALATAIATPFVVMFARAGMSAMKRQAELDAINHAQTVSSLGEIATQGQALNDRTEIPSGSASSAPKTP